MKQNVDWSEVEEAKEYLKVVPGGYICQIMDIEDNEDKEYLKIYYDIVDGDFKNHYSKLKAERDFSLPFFIRSYKDKAMPFFKAMLTAMEGSNKGFIAEAFDNEPEKLVGKYIGLVLGEEEYLGTDGEVKTTLKPQQTRSTKVIKEGNFKVPEIKKLKLKDEPMKWEALDDDELPFL